jgi:hypothetical protein
MKCAAALDLPWRSWSVALGGEATQHLRLERARRHHLHACRLRS